MASLPNVAIEQYERDWKPQFQTQSTSTGRQHLLEGPQPLDDITHDGKLYKPAGKLEGKTAIITGADSGIGRSISLLYALEGADLTMTYLPEEEQDAQDAMAMIAEKTKERTGRTPKLNAIPFDLSIEENCKKLVESHLQAFDGKLDTIALNHGNQVLNEDVTTIPSEQWVWTFGINIHPMFYIVKHALPHMPRGATIVFNGSINTFLGHPELVDYSASKGALVGFMRALSNQVVGERGIRVNMVAPGAIWTPIMPATSKEQRKTPPKAFMTGKIPMGRFGQPVEVASCFVFLASADSGYMSGQTLHPNGGYVIS